MQILDHVRHFKSTRENQEKTIFRTLCIVENRLQTAFDKNDSDITLKQFMLLSMVKQSGERRTLTQLGHLLGCSRQNIKKLAAALQRKGFVAMMQNEGDRRAAFLEMTKKGREYFDKKAKRHRKKLSSVFDDYTDEELERFFILLMRLYGRIDALESE